MGRNCNLELRLVTPSFDDQTVAENIYHSQLMKKEMRNKDPEEKQGYQKLTIFYDGRVSYCDVTEIQARSIISLASQVIVGNKPMTRTLSDSESSPKPRQYKQNTNISIKKSLQQFLQKRRTRIQATSPYSTH